MRVAYKPRTPGRGTFNGHAPGEAFEVDEAFFERFGSVLEKVSATAKAETPEPEEEEPMSAVDAIALIRLSEDTAEVGAFRKDERKSVSEAAEARLRVLKR